MEIGGVIVPGKWSFVSSRSSPVNFGVDFLKSGRFHRFSYLLQSEGLVHHQVMVFLRKRLAGK